MITSLFAIDFRKRLRDPNLKGNIIASIIILASIIFLLFLYKTRLLQFKEFLYQIPLEQFSLLIVCVFVVSDMLLKTLFMHPPLYKPDFIRARPISENVWRGYELLHDTINGWCLYQFVLFIPFCLTYFNALNATLVILLSYLASVFNRLTIKLFARSSVIRKVLTAVSYIVLTTVLAYISIYVKYSETLLISCLLSYLSFVILAIYLYWQTNDYTDTSITVHREQQPFSFSFLKMEFVTIWRSKRMRTNLFLFLFYGILLMAIMTSKPNNIIFPAYIINLLVFTVITYPVLLFQVTYFLGVEANYFCGIHTKPVSTIELLQRKFVFCCTLTLVGGLFLIPMVVTDSISIFKFIAILSYCAGFANLMFFPTMFTTNRLDINTFNIAMNYQGCTKFWILIYIISAIVSVGVFLSILNIFNENIACTLLLSIGVAGILLRKPYFKLLQKIFKTQRYKMMERFRN